jgi:hypothetical protein
MYTYFSKKNQHKYVYIQAVHYLGCISRQKYELYNIKMYIGGIGYEKVEGI